MSERHLTDTKEQSGEYHAPWEKSFDRILTPFEDFINAQTTSGLLLMFMAILAMVLANGPLSAAYAELVQTYISFILLVIL